MSKYISIELDKVRNLRYGMAALEVFEDLSGKRIGELNLKDLSMKDLKYLIYSGLAHEDKDLTPDKARDLVDDYGDITAVSFAIGRALEEAFGKPKGGKGNAPKAAGIGQKPSEPPSESA